jgi:thiol-disulfide isomerase/thioredoxin/tetratricopeptide (TPR) repeat protein
MLLRTLFVLTVAGALGAQTPPGRMTADEAARLEAALEEQPDNERARMRLLLYYASAPPAEAEQVRLPRRKHFLWFVENRPSESLLRTGTVSLDRAGHLFADAEGYELAEKAWRKHFAGEAPAAGVYANAIHFFAVGDPAYAGKLAGESLSRYPKSREVGEEVGRLRALVILGARNLDRYGQILALDDGAAKSEAAQAARNELETTANGDLVAGAAMVLNRQRVPMTIRGRDKQSAEMQALAERVLERARKLDPSNDRVANALRLVYQSAASRERDPQAKVAMLEKAVGLPADRRLQGFVMVDLARAQFDTGAFEQAARTADTLLKDAAAFPEGGNRGGAIHWGNIVLGRIALKNGRIEEAANRLVAAGKTESTPVLMSFGPDWQLAKDLVNQGETKAVLEYIELCRGFWTMGRSSLDRWAAAIRDGGVPNFLRLDAGQREESLAKLVGKPAPELKLKDLGGKTVSLADFKGKTVLIDFWATWCAPCRKEMPAFEKLHREFAGKDVVVLTVDADEPEATPAQYMKDEKFTFPVLLAEGTDTVKRWGVQSFPTTIAVDAEGLVAAFAVGGRSEAELRSLLGKARK